MVEAFDDWRVVGSDVVDDFEDCVVEGITTAAEVSEGCVVIVTTIVLGVPPGEVAGSVMTDVITCVDGGIDDAITAEVTTLADDAGGADEAGGGDEDGAGVETSEDREIGVELGGEDGGGVAVEFPAMADDAEQRSYKRSVFDLDWVGRVWP